MFGLLVAVWTIRRRSADSWMIRKVQMPHYPLDSSAWYYQNYTSCFLRYQLTPVSCALCSMRLAAISTSNFPLDNAIVDIVSVLLKLCIRLSHWLGLLHNKITLQMSSTPE